MLIFAYPKECDDVDASGEWFAVGTDPDELHAEIVKTLDSGEYEIDESDPEIKDINDLTIDDLCEIIDQEGDNEDAFIAWLNYRRSFEYVKNNFEEAYIGEFKNTEDFAREEIENIYDTPDFIKCYIDWDNVSRDLNMDYDYVDAPGGGIYVFRCL